MTMIRPADENEVDALAAIWHSGWQDAHADILPAELAGQRTAALALGTSLWCSNEDTILHGN